MHRQIALVQYGTPELVRLKWALTKLLLLEVQRLLDLSNSLRCVHGAIVLPLETFEQLGVCVKNLPITFCLFQDLVDLTILLHDRGHILRYQLLIDLKLSIALLKVRTMLPQGFGRLRLFVLEL